MTLGRIFIAFCEGGNWATFGDTWNPFEQIQKIWLEYPIKDICMASPIDYMVSGGSGKDKYFLQFGFRSQKDWTDIIDDPVVAMAYSGEAENLGYFVEEKKRDEQIIWQLDFAAGKKS